MENDINNTEQTSLNIWKTRSISLRKLSVEICETNTSVETLVLQWLDFADRIYRVYKEYYRSTRRRITYGKLFTERVLQYMPGFSYLNIATETRV